MGFRDAASCQQTLISSEKLSLPWPDIARVDVNTTSQRSTTRIAAGGLLHCVAFRTPWTRGGRRGSELGRIIS